MVSFPTIRPSAEDMDTPWHEEGGALAWTSILIAMFANGAADHLITDQLMYANDVKFISPYLKTLINECVFSLYISLRQGMMKGVHSSGLRKKGRMLFLGNPCRKLN